MMKQTYRVATVLKPGERKGSCWDLLLLKSDERRVRRRRLELVHGDFVLVDFPEPVTLDQGYTLVLENGWQVEVMAAEEELFEIRGRDRVHLMQLCWHLGNRHVPAQITEEWEGLGLRVLIRRDHVLKAMLLGLGATVTEISEPFGPLEGAYHSHGDTNHVLRNT